MVRMMKKTMMTKRKVKKKKSMMSQMARMRKMKMKKKRYCHVASQAISPALFFRYSAVDQHNMANLLHGAAASNVSIRLWDQLTDTVAADCHLCGSRFCTLCGMSFSPAQYLCVLTVMTRFSSRRVVASAGAHARHSLPNGAGNAPLVSQHGSILLTKSGAALCCPTTCTFLVLLMVP